MKKIMLKYHSTSRSNSTGDFQEFYMHICLSFIAHQSAMKFIVRYNGPLKDTMRINVRYPPLIFIMFQG